MKKRSNEVKTQRKRVRINAEGTENAEDAEKRER